MRVSKIRDISAILFRELIRDKVFLYLILVVVLLAVVSFILNEAAGEAPLMVTRGLGFSALNVFSLFLLIFWGVNLVSKEVYRKVVYFVFSQPVKRWEYLVSSFFAVLLALLLTIGVVSAAVLILCSLSGEVWIPGMLLAGLLTLLEMAVLLSLAVLFAVATPPQLAMFLTLLVYGVGHTIESAVLVVNTSGRGLLKYVVTILYPLLPNLEFFNKKAEIIAGQDIPLSYFLQASLYSLSYSLLIFLLSLFIFSREEV